MTATITPDQQAAIREYLATHTLSAGIGTEESACSIAAINLALYGRLTDTVPECMSEVIGRWIISVQDAMPAEMRNSAAWRTLLPLAAGTGRDLEAARLAIIMDWMWSTALPHLQPVADAGGYGDAWREMVTARTQKAAGAAARAAGWAAGWEAGWEAKAAADAAWAAADAADAGWAAGAAARAAGWAAGWEAKAAADAAWAAGAAADAAWAAGAAARAAGWEAKAAARAAARAAAWKSFDPCALLARLIEVER